MQDIIDYFKYTETDDSIILTSVKDIEHFPTEMIIPAYHNGKQIYLPDDCSDLFRGIYDLETLDLSQIIDTTNVTCMSDMFYYCEKLKTLNFGNFVTSNVRDMSSMFAACDRLQTLDLCNFDTSKVITMSNMFAWCCNLQNLQITNFDISSVISMLGMFAVCKSLQSLDLSNFDTSKVVSMSDMFVGCESLTTTNNPELDKLLPTNQGVITSPY